MPLPADGAGHNSRSKPPSLLLGIKNLKSLGRATENAFGSSTSPGAKLLRHPTGAETGRRAAAGAGRPGGRGRGAAGDPATPAAPAPGERAPPLAASRRLRASAAPPPAAAPAPAAPQETTPGARCRREAPGPAALPESRGAGRATGAPTPGAGVPGGSGEQSGAELPTQVGAERPGGGGAAWPPLLPSSAFPLPPPRGRRPAPCGGGARRWSRCPRPPPAGGAGRARERGSAGRGGGGQRRRGRDSRTLHLQVHLAHLGEPVAQIHGKLLDHCGHTEGRGSGERRREGGRKSVSQSLARRRGGGGRRLFAAASPPAPLHRPCPAARLPRPAHTHSPDSPPDTAWRRPGQRQGASR